MATAAEWSGQPQLTVGIDTDSNRRLDVASEQSQALRVSTSAELAYATSQSSIRLTPRASLLRFDGSDRQLDSNDYGLGGRWETRGEQWQFQLAAGAARDSTLTTELTDTGIIDGRTRRRALDGSLLASYQLTRRSTLQLQGGYTDVDFARAEGTGLVPYGYGSIAAGYRWQATEATNIVLQAFGGRLDTPITTATTNNVGGRVILVSRLSERFSLEGSAGVSRTESGATSDQGAVFALSGNWSNELSEIALSLTRSVEPSARGRLVDSDNASLNIRRRLSERLTLGVSASFVRREDLLFGFFPEQREYANYSVVATLRLNPSMTIEAVAGRADQSFDLQQLEARGSRFGANFVWTPRRLTLSR
jgi:hypothetical protein